MPPRDAFVRHKPGLKRYTAVMAERLRNSINMRTGAISWRGVTPFEIFGFAFQGVVPSHAVQPMLHEFAAHYWCTNTPVSRAIQMRWLDYVRRASMIFATAARR